MGREDYRKQVLSAKMSYNLSTLPLQTKIMDNIQKYVYLICFTGYLREQSRVAMDGATEEEKKTFALTGGKFGTLKMI